jgi:PTS system nitrogen regulatory IIA component
MRFGQALRVFRTAADMGLRELARRVGVSPAYLSLVETGKVGPPSGPRLAQIARALSISPDALLHLTGRTDPTVLEFIQKVPETVELVRAVMGIGLSASEIQSLSRALGGDGGREAFERFLASCSGGNGRGGKTALLDHLDERTVFPKVPCTTREELFGFLSAAACGVRPGLVRERLADLLRERESESSTALGEGVAIPHARVPGLDRPLVILARRSRGIEYPGTEGKPIQIVFLLLSACGGREHLDLLAEIADLCNRPSVRADLLAARGRVEMLSVLRGACDPSWRAPEGAPGTREGEPLGEVAKRAEALRCGGEAWSPTRWPS